jgi:hypothetical protein
MKTPKAPREPREPCKPNKPYKPDPPTKTIEQNIYIKSSERCISLEDFISSYAKDIPLNKIYLEAVSDDHGGDDSYIFCTKKEVENPQYEVQLTYYNHALARYKKEYPKYLEKLKKYKEELKEYKKKLEIYNEERKELEVQYLKDRLNLLTKES